MFEQIVSAAGDAAQMFQEVAQQLVASGQLHQLFDLRLLEHRHRLGLPLDLQVGFDEVPSDARAELEKAYLDACREVGLLLLKQGKAREAWGYLRPVGEKDSVREWLAQAVIDQDNADELIELALCEAIDAQRGFAWLLAQRGTCNGITEFDQLAARLSAKDQSACATVLVRHLHDELLRNIRAQLKSQQPGASETQSIIQIMAEHPDLLADGAYHIDTSHLATTVRYSRALTDPKLISLAIELATYGSKLAKDLQYPDQPPFEDLYRAHLLLLHATTGRDVEQAIDYFRKQADTVSMEYYGTSAIEAYLILLSRIGQCDLALDEYARLVPAGIGLSAHAPTLLQLAQPGGAWQRYLEICEERADAVGYAAGLLARNGAE